MKTTKWCRIFLAAGVVQMAAALGWSFLPKPPSIGDVSYSQLVYDRNRNLLRITTATDQKFRVYTPLEEISQELVKATVFYEDKYYYSHPGINPVAVLRAGWDFLFHRKSGAGASTITMQLARMRYGIHTRSLGGKCFQMFRALQIERHYTKGEILEAYLNIAPYGGNIEGAGAASRIYFGKAASELTLPEAVSLSVIPQNPIWRALRREDSAYRWIDAQDRVFHEMDGVSHVKEFRAPMTREIPFHAPHFTTHILAESGGVREIVTTLDFRLQRLLERRLQKYVESKASHDIRNAAALLVDSRTMEVLAKAGSVNFFNPQISGQVDGTRSRRSPGSTLKPFIYALAMDQGLIHPHSLLKDAPRSFGAYDPENYDRDFVGPIHAADALVRSRNIPAIYLASQLSRPTLYRFLKNAQIDLPQTEQHYGLSLSLGGAEVTMEELVCLYGALANHGIWRPLGSAIPLREGEAVKLLSPEASFLTLEMLRRNPRPGLGNNVLGSVAWKTGTSNGFRDAWAVGVFGHYVLAVWIGNFDGKSNPAFEGRTCAGPLMFHIIDALHAERYDVGTAHEAPSCANLKQVDLCAVSGQLPTDACVHRVQGWFIPGVSPITTCDVHRKILVDAKSGLRVAEEDENEQVRREVYEFWPSDLLKLFEMAGLPRRCAPPFSPAGGINNVARRDNPPVIISPAKNITYNLQAIRKKQAIPLRVNVEGGGRKIYWFADKVFLGATDSRETLAWHPHASGKYHILALDDFGRSDISAVTVEALEVDE